jgi:hypothetical protein
MTLNFILIIFFFANQRFYAFMAKSMTTHGEKSGGVRLSILSIADRTLELRRVHSDELKNVYIIE